MGSSTQGDALSFHPLTSVSSTERLLETLASSPEPLALGALTQGDAGGHRFRTGARFVQVGRHRIHPAWVARPLAASEDPAAERVLEVRQPAGRLVTTEVAQAIDFLATPASAAPTGTVLSVDEALTGPRLPPTC